MFESHSPNAQEVDELDAVKERTPKTKSKTVTGKRELFQAYGPLHYIVYDPLSIISS